MASAPAALAVRLAPVLAFMAAALAGIHAIDASPVGVFYDDAQYVILGRSLASGDGYRYLNLPGAPVATHFPPGYPALLALLWKLSPDFPGNIALFKMTNAVLLGLVAVATWWAARRLALAGPASAAVATAAGTLTIPALVLSSGVMSEVLFLALLLPLLVVAERWTEQGGLARAAALGAAAGVLFLVRSHGIVLVAAVAAGFALRRHHRAALVATVVAMCFVVPWMAFVRHHDALIPEPLRGQYGSYGAWLADGLAHDGPRVLVMALRDNVVTSYAIVARSFSVAEHWLADAIAVLAVASLCAAGVVALLGRARVTLIFLAGYLAIVIVWPFSPLRFLWGIWPLLMLLVVAGAAHLRRGASGPQPAWTRRMGVAAGVVVLAGALVFNVRGYVNEWWATVSRSVMPRIQPQLAWVDQHTRAGDVVAADDEGAVFLYTGRRAVPANAFTVAQYFAPRPAPENAARLREILRVTSAGYVIAWARPTQDAAALLARDTPPALVLVDTIPTGAVYRATRPAR